MSEQIYMVFDVESIGLHGEGFAIGYVVVNHFGVEIMHALISCSQHKAVGAMEDQVWVHDNIPDWKPTIACSSPSEVRMQFWGQWLCWKERGAILAADCCWPVEARFLAACVDDNTSRKWEGPYPLHDIASIILAKGGNPVAKFPRLDSELPEHNPLNDARQSARILVETLHPK